LFSGKRLLIQRGIRERDEDKGKIVSRYEDRNFCFNELLYGVTLQENTDQLNKLILGILWSSLARYYFFMTSGAWMPWHPKISLEDILGLPIKNAKTDHSVRKLIEIVDKLRNYHPQKKSLLHQSGVPEENIEATRRQWESELDEAVFELYGLSEEQKDLIRDCCDVTLPFFYKPFDSIGTMPAIENNNIEWLETNYIRIFCKRWNVYLGTDEEMRAEIHVGAHGNMVAIEFYPADKGDSWNLKPKDNTWGYVLEQLGKSLPQPMGTSQIVLDGLVHVVSKDGIIIIKRNEKRFWTRSLSREDADVTLYKRMVTTMPKEERTR
jgi:hypothetical protein